MREAPCGGVRLIAFNSSVVAGRCQTGGGDSEEPKASSEAGDQKRSRTVIRRTKARPDESGERLAGVRTTPDGSTVSDGGLYGPAGLW